LLKISQITIYFFITRKYQGRVLTTTFLKFIKKNVITNEKKTQELKTDNQKAQQSTGIKNN
jgi:hypothetical protein